MAAFFEWFFAFITTMAEGLWKVVSGFITGFGQVFNIVFYIAQFKDYKASFGIIDWIFAIISLLVVIAIWGTLFYLIFILVRKYIRFRKSAVGNEDLLEEVANLHRDVIKLTKEKERILALRIGQTSISIDDLNAIYGENEDGEAEGEGEEKTEGSSFDEEAPEFPVRFARLDAIDQKYRFYTEPEYRTGFTLEELCDDFRNFACSRMGLYYEHEVVRLFFAGLASTKLILLQGISGTGKTSLPYAVGKFLNNDTTIVSVQPSWRDRTELFGYFNEFSKKFNETEVLQIIFWYRQLSDATSCWFQAR